MAYIPNQVRLTSSEVWRRAGVMPLRRHLPALKTPWSVDRDDHGRIECCDVGGLRLAKIRVSHRLTVEQGADAVSRAPAGYRLLIVVSGSALLEQAGREVMLNAGEWVLYKSNAAFALQNLEPGEQRMVGVPARDLCYDLGSLDQLTVKRLGGNDHSSGQLVTLLESAFDIAAVHGAEAAYQLAGAALHLSRLALIENAGPESRCLLSDVMRDRILQFAQCNLRDPGLSIASIAASLNCSKRYLHKVFSRDGETLRAYLLQLRLQRCHAELAADHRPRSIAEVAYSWGFKSLSHFNREFVRRYGMTPGERRNTQGRSGAESAAG